MLYLCRRLLLPVACCLLWSCQPDKPPKTELAAPAVAPTDTLPEPLPHRAPDSVTWHRATATPVASAPLIRQGMLRRRVTPRDTAALPPAEARLYDLTLKASEYHKIDPTRLAEVRGQEGTVLRIPAGTLVNAREEPATGPVFVELKECYELADIVLSNLLTETVDDQLLTTGGMILVRASSGGQPLHVAVNKAVQVELAAPRRPEWQLYYGRSGRRQPVRWVAAGPGAAVDEQVYNDAQIMPMYGSGAAVLNKLVRYPATPGNGQQGTVYVSAVVDEAGRVLFPKVLRGLGGAYDAEALRVLRQTSGDWTPGQRAGRLAKVKVLIPIRFALPNDPTPGAEAAPDSTNAAVAPPTLTPTDAPASIAASSDRVVLGAGQLGWLAVGRPRGRAETVTTLTAAVEPDTHTSVRLLLRDAPTIILGQPTDTGYDFVDVPANKRAVLIGIRYMSGVPYVAVRETTTGRAATESLRFRETTLGELEQLLRKFE